MMGDKSNFKILESVNRGSVTFESNQRKNKIIRLWIVSNNNIKILNVYLIDGLNYNLLSII
jgi:hypothetical protein